jgi:copper transport protein
VSSGGRAGDPYRPLVAPGGGDAGAAARRLVLKRFVVAGAIGATLALLPVVALAHARLVISDPAPGAVLDTLPATVDLVFSEPVTPAGRGINVYGPDGRLVSIGSARARGDGLSVGMSGSLAGTYAVVWTVVASDTHPSRGEFAFSVGHASPVRAPGFGGGDVGLVAPLGLVLQSLGRWMHFAGYALGFGAATYALFVARDPRPLRLAGAGIALLLVAEPLALFAQTASLDPSQTFDGDALTGALASPFGRVLALRLGGALVLWAVLGALRQAPWLRWAIPGLGIAMALVDATAAHATPALPQPLGLVLNALHVAAMGVWLGGVVAFAIAPSGGFGRVADWSLGLLIVSGAALAILHFDSPLELVTTPYGAALAIKLPLVAIALFFAWRARHRWELATLLVVIAAASVVVSLPPPR